MLKKTLKQLEAGRKNSKTKRGETAGSKALVKKMTPEEFDLVKSVVIGGSWSDGIIENFGEELLPSIRAGKLDMETIRGSTEKFRKALTLYGLDTHFPLEETVAERYRPLVMEFSRKLIQDYNCQTAGEKALAEVIVSAYARILTYSRQLGGATQTISFTKVHVELYSMLSKELDRANRHFITALTTLKQLKAPSLEISVKAKTAFVAQNQQINATNNPTSKEDEIIDPK